MNRLSSDVVSALRTDVTITSAPQCVTELVLNSIDAKATSIAVRVDLNLLRIQVIDNGCGISSEDLHLLGNRYMTSKCHSLNDLRSNLSSFGFRGEALASLCEVAGTIIITSRPSYSDDTYTKIISQGRHEKVVRSSRPRPAQGTTILVGDFLYNRPVRRARVKAAFDLEEIKTHMEYIALIHPQLSFSLRDDTSGQVILETRKSNTVVETFRSLFGPAIAENLRPVRAGSKLFEISGYISKEAHARKNLQFIYINKRLVLKSKLHKLVNSIMGRSSILKMNNVPQNPISKELNSAFFLAMSPPKRSKHAVYILNVFCPYSEYDITLDPKKTLIEFKDWGTILDCFETLLRNFLEPQSSPTSPVNESSVLDEINQLAREDALPRCGEISDNFGPRQVLGLPARRDTVVYTPPSQYSKESTIISSDGEEEISTLKTTYSEDPFPAHLRGNPPLSASSENPFSVDRPSNRCCEFDTTSQEGTSTSARTFLTMFKQPVGHKKLKHLKPQSKLPVGDPKHFERNLQKLPDMFRPAQDATDRVNRRRFSTQEHTTMLSDSRQEALSVHTTYTEDPFCVLPGRAPLSEKVFSAERPSDRCREFDTISQEDSTTAPTKDAFKQPFQKPKHPKAEIKLRVGDPKHFALNLQRFPDMFQPLRLAEDHADRRKQIILRNLQRFSNEKFTKVYPSSDDTNKYHTPLNAQEKNGSVDTGSLADLPFASDLEAHLVTPGDCNTPLDQMTLRNKSPNTGIALEEDRETKSPLGSDLETRPSDFLTAYQNSALSLSPEDTRAVSEEGSSLKCPVNERIDDFRQDFLLETPISTNELPRDLLSSITDDKEPKKQVQSANRTFKVFTRSEDFLVPLKDVIESHVIESRSPQAEFHLESQSQEDSLSTVLELLRTASDDASLGQPAPSSNNNADACTSPVVYQESSEKFSSNAQQSSSNSQNVETFRGSPPEVNPTEDSNVISATSPSFIGFSSEQPCENNKNTFSDSLIFSDLLLEKCVRDNPRKRNIEKDDTVEPMRKIVSLKTTDVDIYSNITESEVASKESCNTIIDNLEEMDIASPNSLIGTSQSSQYFLPSSGKFERRSVMLDCSIADLRAVLTPRRNEDRKSTEEANVLSDKNEVESGRIPEETTAGISAVGDKIEVETAGFSERKLTEGTNHVVSDDSGVETGVIPEGGSTEETNTLSDNNEVETGRTSGGESTEQTNTLSDSNEVETSEILEQASHRMVDLQDGMKQLEKMESEDSSEADIQNTFNVAFSSSHDSLLTEAYDQAMLKITGEEQTSAERLLDSEDLPQDKTNRTEAEADVWEERFDNLGRKYFVHSKSGVIRFDKKRTESFTMEKRCSIFPGKLSSFVDDLIKSRTTHHLNSTTKEFNFSSLLEQSRLANVKWPNGKPEEKSWRFVDHLLTTLEPDKGIPVTSTLIEHRRLSQIKVYNVCYPYTFNKNIFRNLRILGQLDRKFIVAIAELRSSTEFSEVIILFDQHAVHERIRVEQLTKEYQEDGAGIVWRSAPVHPPLPLALSAREIRVMTNSAEKLRALGLRFSKTDSHSVRITGVPTCLLLREDREVHGRGTSVLKSHLESLIREQVDALIETRGAGVEQPAIIRNVIASEACKGAVKFGHPLETEDCRAFLHNLSSCDVPFQCAHGRPVLTPIADLSHLPKPTKPRKLRLWKLRRP